MADFHLPKITVESITTEASEIPWGVQMVNAPKVWEKTKGNGIVVAVLDTGVDSNHPDLAGRIIGGKNFTSDYNGDPNNFHDNQSHGTHCAGTIAAIQNNLGVIGVAPDVKLLVGKVLCGDGSGSYDYIINGIKWAVDWRGPNGERTRIISMSLGGPEHYPGLLKAIQYAVNNDVLVVAAAGNEGDGSVATSEYSYPGAYSEVVEVGAINVQKRLAMFSNTNTELDVVAPGVDVLSTIPGGGWAKFSGTSMATPHVAGAAALLLAMHETPEKKLTESELYQLLMKNTVDAFIDVKGQGKGMVVLTVKEDEPVVSPIEEPIVAPAPVEEVPVPVTDREYKVSLRRVGNKYTVEIGNPVKLSEAAKLARQVTQDLDSLDGVKAIL